MPSGSKRRKTAKKKKENQPNTNPNSSSVSPRSQGDDVKHHSDVGEVSSPGSQDDGSHSKEEIEKIEVGDQKPNKEAGEGIIVIQREIKNENESDGGSSESSSSSSSSSGSDDESHGVKGSEDVAGNSPVDSVQVTDEEVIYSTAVEDSCDSVEEIITVNVETVEEGVVVSKDSPAVDYAPPHIVESVFNEENEEKQGSCSVGGEVVILEASIDAIIASVEGEARILEASNDVVITPVENVVSISETKECVVAQETEDNGAGIEISSGVTEPLLAAAPRQVERTSWKSCCGLFDLFSGSGR